MTSTPPNSRRLIEDWLPINEISIESIRERAGAVPNPAPHQLHVWWARRPLATSRAAVAASLLSTSPSSKEFYDLIGSHAEVVTEQRDLEKARFQGVRLKQGYSRPRAFTHNITEGERSWLQANIPSPNPTVLDITAGGGSIPFEATRLGLKTIVNELNPVAGLILRATCEWPQKYGWDLLEHFKEVSNSFLNEVRRLTTNLYPVEPQPSADPADGRTDPKRETQACLFARTVACPSCEGTIPLSPNWRLNSTGTGINILPDVPSGTCSFKIVNKAAEHSSGTIYKGKATCPYPNCGVTTPVGYISEQARRGCLGHQLYCIVYRDSWQAMTQKGRPSKRRKTSRGFRIPRSGDNNTAEAETCLEGLAESWERDSILPTEDVQSGDKTKTLLDYGMPKWRDTFNPRQLLSHGYCVQAFRRMVDDDRELGKLSDTRKAAWCYVALAIDKLLDRNCLMSPWDPVTNKVAHLFATHSFSMKWSYAEMPIANQGWGLEWALGDVRDCLKEIIQMTGHPEAETGKGLLMPIEQNDNLTAPPSEIAIGPAQDTSIPPASIDVIVFDPPYHNNVNYAELSDFFYVWLKRTAGYVLGDGMLAPHLTDKVNEAIASPARFRQDAQSSGISARNLATRDYEDKMAEIFRECRRVIKPDGIMTVMFTHKSTDAWDALTVALIESGFGITRTWPVKTEPEGSTHIKNQAAARSTILLVCRPRTANPTPGALARRGNPNRPGGSHGHPNPAGLPTQPR